MLSTLLVALRGDGLSESVNSEVNEIVCSRNKTPDIPQLLAVELFEPPREVPTYANVVGVYCEIPEGGMDGEEFGRQEQAKQKGVCRHRQSQLAGVPVMPR